jgi:excinuclease ABC subunit A
MTDAPATIRIRGARTHNLKGVDLDIPRGSLVVVTGPSGSGKSSLAFDTIYAEGQRRFVESLAPYARQLIGQMAKPDVESMDGLTPTIAIDQRSAGRNPRSTVGTVTEVYDFLRLLYARVGEPHCPRCGREVAVTTVDEMVDHVLGMPRGTRFAVLAPFVRGRTGDFKRELKRLKREGFVRVMVDGEVRDLSDDIPLAKAEPHTIHVYVDRLVNDDGIRNRLADSVELALGLAEGLVVISPIEGEDITFSDRYACIECGISLPDLAPTLFSFNNPAGACPDCTGLGETSAFDEDLIVPDPTLSLREGAIAPWSRRNAAYYQQLLEAVAARNGIDLFAPWRDLPEASRRVILDGTSQEVEFSVDSEDRRLSFKRRFEGVIANLSRRSREYERRKTGDAAEEDYDFLADEFSRFMRRETCRACEGARLKPESLNVLVAGRSIAQVAAMTVEEAASFFSSVALPPRRAAIAERILSEVSRRLDFLTRVGLDYLTMDRPTATLSGGEAQRIRLATQIGSALVGVTYVLDEPSIGLHPRDVGRLTETLRGLVAHGNSVIVVEHDEATIREADHVIDMGPGAGALGGRVVAQGTPAEIAADPGSVTGRYLCGRQAIDTPARRRAPDSRAIVVTGARINNLKSITARFPLGLLVAVTGVSGSGKSSLVVDTLLPALRQRLYRTGAREIPLDRALGLEHVDKVIDIDQSPIGRTPRSNPATFTAVLTDIREVFAGLPDSRMRGYKPGRYSFNVKGGRCEACQGDGLIRVEMNFLPDMFVECEVCGGRRYNRETLEIRYKGRSIADVLDMTASTALEFFASHSRICSKLATFEEVGLGYLRLGQGADTLSGGEAQRLKLARELARRATGRTVYILDEPTTGLHFDDVRRLLEVLGTLVDQGNTVIVIEHNLDVVKCADWVIDLGPEGGAAGGEIVVAGTPETVAACRASHTGRYLALALARRGT